MLSATFVGAEGCVEGIAEVGSAGSLDPTALMATTLKEY